MTAEYDSASLLDFAKNFAHGPCYEDLLESVRAKFDQVNVGAMGESSPSKQLKERVESGFMTAGWDNHVLLDRQLPSELPLANYIIDYQIIFSAINCDVRHQLVIEMCFDNRQAIGTNLLKVDLANRKFTATNARDSLGVLVVLNSKAREKGHWDNGVGVQDEYSLALRRGYADVIQSPIALLVIT